MRYIYIFLIVVLTVLIVVFTFQNLDIATVTLLSAKIQLPTSLLVIIVYVMGIVTGGSARWLLRTLIEGSKKS